MFVDIVLVTHRSLLGIHLLVNQFITQYLLQTVHLKKTIFPLSPGGWVG